MVGGCTDTVSGRAVGSTSAPSGSAGKPGAAAELASTGPRIAVPKKPNGPAPCTIANQAQLNASLGQVTRAPAALSGNANSCVWPLGSGPKDGFLVGYGISFDDVVHTHPAAGGAFERRTDGNSTWLWCDVSNQTGAFTCGAAIAVSVDRTFVTGLVRSPGAGRTKTSVLAELQPVTIALFRSLPGV